MTRLFFILLFITSATLIHGAAKKTSAQKTINFSFDDFEKVTELKGEKLNLEEPLMNPLDIILADTLLFIRNQNASPMVDIISLNSGKTIIKFGKRGRGPGELVGPFYLQFIEDEKKFILQDLVGDKIVFYD